MFRQSYISRCTLACVVIMSTAQFSHAQINWTANGPGISWGTGSNWSNNIGPGPLDIARFTGAGAANSPVVLTNTVDASRIIGGLDYETSDAHFQVTNLAGFTLTVAGDLDSGFDIFNNATNYIKGSGTLNVGSAQTLGNVYVGRADIANGSQLSNTVDLSGITAFNGQLNNLWVGTTSAGQVSGQVALPASNLITANSVRIGYSTVNANSTSNLLTLGTTNTINASEFSVGGQLSNGTVTIPVNGTLNLGTALNSTALTIGRSNVATAFSFTASMNLSGATFNATLSNLLVGEKTFGGGGGVSASLLGGNGGAITVGTSGNTANFLVAHASGGNGSSAIVDFSGQTSLNANLNDLYIGTSEGGTANGTLSMATTNNISANAIRVGYSTNDPNTGTNLLALGTTNTINAPEFTVGGQLADGSVTIPVNGTLNLGTAANSTALTIGRSNASSPFAFSASMNLSGATFNATLSNLLVGEKTLGGGGGMSASLIGGNNGAITVGVSGNTANLIVGHTSGGNGSSALVDLSGQTSLTANLNSLYVGTSEVGTATGVLKLAATNNINANAVRVGFSTNDPNAGTNLLALGASNTITANEFTVGGQLANGTVTIPSNGTLNLGSALQSTALTVGRSNATNGTTFNASMNLANATFNATLSNLLVGEKTLGGGGGVVASLVGGNNGVITVGTSGNTANFIVGHTSGGNSSSGIVDFSSQTSLICNVNDFYIGTAEVGTATGTVKLAATNNINANAIRVGYSTNDATSTSNVLVLGKNNTITTNEFTVGGPLSIANVSVVPGGTTNIGTSGQRAELYIARNDVNTNAQNSGILDLTGSTVNAFLDATVIGNKSNGGTGSAIGTLTTGTNGTIDGHSFTLGVGTGSGTINFNGGTLKADTIAKGTGTAQFNWNSGTLHVGTFGTTAIPFNLVNSGTGVLAPGDDPGLTHIFGNYTQGAQATLQIELGGTLPGTGFDQVVDAGATTLAGTLNVSLFGGFQPTVNESFVILTANSVIGTFTNLSLPTLASDLAWQVVYQPTYVSLNVVPHSIPEPATLSLFGMGTACLVGIRMRLRGSSRKTCSH